MAGRPDDPGKGRPDNPGKGPPHDVPPGVPKGPPDPPIPPPRKSDERMVDPCSSMTSPAGPIPRWEKRYPGRLKFELDALRAAGITPEIDELALAAGRLSLTFDWPLDKATTLRLQAVFPDAYPHFRPQVFLLAGLDPPACAPPQPYGGQSLPARPRDPAVDTGLVALHVAGETARRLRAWDR